MPRRSRFIRRTAAEGARVTAMSEWLQLMLAEIARKREEVERARAEEAQRIKENESDGPHDEHGARENLSPR